MKNISTKLIKLSLATLGFLFVFNTASSQFNADPLEKWKVWGSMDEPLLENGNASHGLSAAEIIYYLAKRHKINPVLILAKLQDEQSLIDYPYKHEDLTYHLNKATGYGCNGTNSNCSGYLGFYPQVAGCAFQYKKYMKQGKNFKQSYETYTMAPGAYNNFITKIYPRFARKMNEICGTSYKSVPTTKGYYTDFVNEMSVEKIQKFLNAYNGTLKDENLFKSFVVYEETKIPYEQVVIVKDLDSIYSKVGIKPEDSTESIVMR